MIRLVVRSEFSAGSCLVVERMVVADTKSRYVCTVLHIQDTVMLLLRSLVDQDSSSLNATCAVLRYAIYLDMQSLKSDISGGGFRGIPP